MNGTELADRTLDDLISDHRDTREKMGLQKTKCIVSIILSNSLTTLFILLFSGPADIPSSPTLLIPSMEKNMIRIKMPVHLQIPMQVTDQHIDLSLYDSAGKELVPGARLYPKTMEEVTSHFESSSLQLFTVDLPQTHLHHIVKMAGRPVWGYPVRKGKPRASKSKHKERLPYEIIF